MIAAVDDVGAAVGGVLTALGVPFIIGTSAVLGLVGWAFLHASHNYLYRNHISF